MLKEIKSKGSDENQLLFMLINTDLVVILLAKRLFFLPQVSVFEADDHQLIVIPNQPEPKLTSLDHAHLLVSLYLSMVVSQQMKLQITVELSADFVKALKGLPPVYQSMLDEILTAIKA